MKSFLVENLPEHASHIPTHFPPLMHNLLVLIFLFPTLHILVVIPANSR